MQNGAILLKPQFYTVHFQWECQVKYPDKHKPPLQMNADSTTETEASQHFPSFKAVPLRRGRTAPPPREELEKEKCSELLKSSGCFRNQVPHLPQEHLSPSWRSKHRGSQALNSAKLHVGSICSGLEVETDQTAQCICPTQNITETDPEEPFPNVHCASTNNTAQNPNQA